GACRRVLLAKLFDDFRIELKAEKRKIQLIQEGLDGGDSQPVLHDVEEHVAAAARAVEIDRLDQRFPARLVLVADDCLPESADAFGGRLITTRGNNGACFDNRPSRDLAVKADAHRSVWRQQ